MCMNIYYLHIISKFCMPNGGSINQPFIFLHYITCLVCGPISFLASYERLPYFSHACIDAIYDDPYYSNLVRLTGSTSLLSNAFTEIFHQYGWTKVRRSASTCEQD